MDKLTEQYNVVCANCEQGDELTQDALCVWCQRCGPSYPVRAPRQPTFRYSAYNHLAPWSPALASQKKGDGRG